MKKVKGKHRWQARSAYTSPPLLRTLNSGHLSGRGVVTELPEPIRIIID